MMMEYKAGDVVTPKNNEGWRDRVIIGFDGSDGYWWKYTKSEDYEDSETIFTSATSIIDPYMNIYWELKVSENGN